MADKKPIEAEVERLRADATRSANWKRWGPYLSERQWGTVREDYSPDGNAWNYFPHDHARSRAYRWGEDGLLGICDRECRLCFGLALWNGKDPILKERLFGLSNPEGNHGEDCKELYWFLDATPTSSYLKGLYKYPQAAYPYQQIINENRRRSRADPEYEVQDTGVFDGGRYFDVFAEYAKASSDDILIRITVVNRGPEPAELHLLPTVWFRNAWTWGCTHEGCYLKPLIKRSGTYGLITDHVTLGKFRFEIDPANSAEPPRWLFTDNETNYRQVFDCPNQSKFVKDAFHEFVVHGREEAVDPAMKGTKAAPHYEFVLQPGETRELRFRLFQDAGSAPGPVSDAGESTRAVTASPAAVGRALPAGGTAKARTSEPATIDMDLTNLKPPAPSTDRSAKTALSPAGNARPTAAAETQLFGPSFEAMFVARQFEADLFYSARIPTELSLEEQRVMRQSFAGLLWSKQFFHYVVHDWLHGDPNMPSPPERRLKGRNSDWKHLFNRDVISMPDTWEYPWYASWDLAFHMIPMAHVDPQFAKDQLILLLREWYMHPNGQMPAYEWAFDDVNPPVHAWACWRVYKISGQAGGGRDKLFLRRAFQKLMINFTWWVNRKDPTGKHVFAGGFLGMDNIGLFDRSAPLPDGTFLNQADGTAWMAFFCGVMLDIALELARDDPAYEDVASKFFEHFVAITDAMNTLGGTGLWDEEDGFYYDQLAVDGVSQKLRVRSMVGIIPLLACQVIDEERLETNPGFGRRTRWFLEHRQDLAKFIAYLERSHEGQAPGSTRARFLLAVPSQEKLERALKYVLDENEFLSPHGIRSMSRYHKDHPVSLKLHGKELNACYAPGDSDTAVFGGNSNWRGPIWFPTNFLLIEALQRYYHFYGDTLKVECPTGSGVMMNLAEVARELERRLVSLFVKDKTGRIPANGGCDRMDGINDKHFRDLVLFYEYFDGDTGRGLGASHQTGWTALVARILRDLGRQERDDDVKQKRAEPKTTTAPATAGT